MHIFHKRRDGYVGLSQDFSIFFECSVVDFGSQNLLFTAATGRAIKPVNLLIAYPKFSTLACTKMMWCHLFLVMRNESASKNGPWYRISHVCYWQSILRCIRVAVTRRISEARQYYEFSIADCKSRNFRCCDIFGT